MYICAIMELKLLYTNNKVTDWKRISQFVCLLGLNIQRPNRVLLLLVLGTGVGVGTGLRIAHLKHSDPQKYERLTAIATMIAEHLGVGDLASAKQSDSEYTAAALLKIPIAVWKWKTVTNRTQRTNC